MRRILWLTSIAMASLLSACASANIDLKSVRIAYESDEGGPLVVRPRPRVILRIDYTTTFDFEAHGAPRGYLIPCGAARNHLGRPIGGDYEASDIVPRVTDESKIPGEVFSARFDSDNHLFSVTPSDAAPPNGIWSVRFTDLANAQGVCFFVMSGGNLFDSPSSPTFRIDGMIQAQRVSE